jgi:hypothetical protein
LRCFELGDVTDGVEGAASGTLVPLVPGSRLLIHLSAAGSAIENAGDAVTGKAKGTCQTAFMLRSSHSFAVRTPVEVCLFYPLFCS